MAKTSTKEPKKGTKKTKVVKAPVVEEKKEEIKIDPIELEEVKFDDVVKEEEPAPTVEVNETANEIEVKSEPEKPKSKISIVRQYFTNFWNGMAMDD